MRKLFFVFAIVLTMGAFAQETTTTATPVKKERRLNRTPEEISDLQTSKMTKNLNLSATQQKEVKALFLENAKKREAKKINKEDFKNLSPEQKSTLKKEMLHTQTQNNEKLKQILDAQQYSKWEQIKKDQRLKMRKQYQNHMDMEEVITE